MTDSPATRQSLLVRLKDPKDGQAWGEFVAIYAPIIDRLARAKGFQEADAADLAQDVFRAVAGAIDRYDPDPARGSFRGWLFRIARNLMINLLAARRVRPQATGDPDVRELLDRVPAPDSAETARSTPSTAAGSSTGQPSRSAASSATPPGRPSG
ncbi:MAG: sigma-70 family RNA polymerase sigma factor [Isosphaeraceae bacterium]